MRKNFSDRTWETFPRESNNIQVNVCKTFYCSNFGVSPHTDDSPESPKQHPLYSSSGTGKNEAAIICKECKKSKEIISETQASWVMKSNEGIHQEFSRFWSYLDTDTPISCPNDKCKSHSSPEIKAIKKRGLTKNGVQRYYCKLCKLSFINQPHTRLHQRSEINRQIFSLLVCHVPLRKIIKHLRISPRTIYLKIDFLHQQCLEFAAHHERKLLNGTVELPQNMHLSTDRQVVTANWTRCNDRRTTEIYGIGTACQKTGYVFGYHFNYDGSLSQAQVEAVAKENNDLEKPKHHRKTARIWLEQDFLESVTRSAAAKTKRVKLSEDITDIIPEGTSEALTTSNRLPVNGVLIHNEYTMMGHFEFIKKFLNQAPRLVFHIDSDKGMKSALVSIFAERIKEGTCHGTLLQTKKDSTQAQKLNAVNETNKLIKERCGIDRQLLSGLEFYEVSTEIVKDHISGLQDYETLEHPIARMTEPKKTVTAITALSSLDPDDRVDIYWRASLHPIDRFFMQLRRAINIFERSLNTGTKDSSWSIYSPYNPAIFQKLGDIYRVYYNYCELGDDKRTPAMDLGLTGKAVELEKIIYFGRDKIKAKPHTKTG